VSELLGVWHTPLVSCEYNLKGEFNIIVMFITSKLQSTTDYAYYELVIYSFLVVINIVF